MVLVAEDYIVKPPRAAKQLRNVRFVPIADVSAEVPNARF